MIDYAPIARIILRYPIGYLVFASGDAGERLAADPDLVFFVGLGLATAVEVFYTLAKRKGWTT